MAYLRQKNIFDQFGLSNDWGLGSDSSSPYEDYDQSPSRGPLISRGPVDQPQQPEENPPPYQEDTGGNKSSDLTIKPLRVQTFADSMTKNMTPQEEIDLINQVFTPSTVDRDRLRALLDNPPQREEPGLGRRFIAAGIGLGNKSRNIPGGIAEQEKVLYAPFLRDMAEWKEKITPAQSAAQYENTANAQERNLATTAVTSSVAARRADQQAEAARDRDATLRAKQENDLKIAQTRAAAFEAKRLGAKFFNVNGTLQGVYPDGTKVNFGDSRVWSDAELLNLQHDLKIDEAKQVAAITGPTGTNPADPKKADEAYQLAKQRALEYYFSVGNKYVKKSPTGYELAQKPVVGSGYPWAKVTPKDVADWYEVAKNVFPNMPPPPELSGEGQQQQQPGSVPQPERGIGPSQIPSTPPVPGRGSSIQGNPGGVPPDMMQEAQEKYRRQTIQTQMDRNMEEQKWAQSYMTNPNVSDQEKQQKYGPYLEKLAREYNELLRQRDNPQQPSPQGQGTPEGGGASPRFDVQGGRINLPPNATPQMAADAADLATNKAVLAVDAQGLQHVIHVDGQRIPDNAAAITYALGKGWKVIPISR